MGNLSSAYSAGRFALELDERQPVGFVRSIAGGQLKSDSIVSMVGLDGVVNRHAGRPRYDDITVCVGMSMSPTFWRWIQACIDREPQRHNGAVVSNDFNHRERSRRTFYRALIAEIGFPALDAATKETASLTVKLSPERIIYEPGRGAKLAYAQSLNQNAKQKLWLASNFRFQLDRFKGDESLRYAKIDAFTVKQNIIDNPVGHELEARKEVGRLELPRLSVTFPEARLAEWMTWFRTAVVHGDRKDQLTTGAITYFASDGKRTELMRLELDGVSLVALEADKHEAMAERIANIKATLNIESIKLRPGYGTT
jgi:hypothetical protein